MASAAKAAAWIALAAVVAVAVAEEGEDRDGRSGSSMLVDIARELVARSGTSSQVLSLNLTNLVILLVLKGLLVGAAMWGAKGHPGGHGGPDWQRSRADDPAPPSATFFSEPELALLITYLMGESGGSSGGDTCLLRVACEEPKKAREYIAAGKMTLKAARILDKVFPVNPKYMRLLDDVTAAAKLGADGGAAVCRQTYSCGDGGPNNNRL